MQNVEFCASVQWVHVKEAECSLKYEYGLGDKRLCRLASQRGRVRHDLAHQRMWVCGSRSCSPFFYEEIMNALESRDKN